MVYLVPIFFVSLLMWHANVKALNEMVLLLEEDKSVQGREDIDEMMKCKLRDRGAQRSKDSSFTMLNQMMKACLIL